MKDAHRQPATAEGAVEAGFLEVGDRPRVRRIAYLRRTARGLGEARPGIMWLGGLKSDMRGVKAERLDLYAAATGRAFLRFDYSGHGASDGRFEAGAIGRGWRRAFRLCAASREARKRWSAHPWAAGSRC